MVIHVNEFSTEPYELYSNLLHLDTNGQGCHKVLKVDAIIVRVGS